MKFEKIFIQKNPWIIIPAILFMGITFIYNIKSIHNNSESNKWHATDYREMVEKCLKRTGDIGVKYPKVSEEYCECSAKSIQASINKEKYIELLDKDPSQQAKIITPIIQDCMRKYQDTINSLINQ